MPIRMIFRCEFCDAVPNEFTQRGLEFGMRHAVFGEFRDASPERWLVWYGRGVYGHTRYACPDHRGDLVALLRTTYGTVGWHPWKMGPYQSTWFTRGNEPENKRAGGSHSRGGGWG